MQVSKAPTYHMSREDIHFLLHNVITIYQRYVIITDGWTDIMLVT